MSVLLLGLDPGFAALGWSLLEVHPTAGMEPARIDVVDLGVCETSPDSRKSLVLRSDDNLRRARELAAFLYDKTLASMRRGRLVAICAESFSPPRNSSAAAKVAMTWGALAAISVQAGVPIVQCSPQQLKIALCGSKSASKQDIMDAIDARFGTAVVPLLRRIAKGKWNHAYDAVGAAMACHKADVIQIALRASPVTMG
jgi:crossover junction endodeoxyribonuclease RuvC